MATTNDRPRNTDYDRVLRSARGHAAHVGRIAARLLDEGTIGLGQHDAIATAVSELLHDAYQAGRCEPEGVGDLHTEMRAIRSCERPRSGRTAAEDPSVPASAG